MEQDSFYVQRRRFALAVSWAGPAPPPLPPFECSTTVGDDSPASSPLLGGADPAASFRAKAASAKRSAAVGAGSSSPPPPLQRRFVELSRAGSDSALHRFCLEADHSQQQQGEKSSQAPSSATRAQAAAPGSPARRLTEEEQAEAQRSAPIPVAPRVPEPSAVRLTCCGNSLGSLYRQTYADHCVTADGHGAAALLSDPLRNMVASAWDGESVTVVEHFEPERSRTRPLLMATLPDRTTSAAGATLLQTIIAELQAEAQRRCNSVFTAAVFGSIVTMDAAASASGHGPRLLDSFAQLNPGATTVPGALPCVIGTSNGPLERVRSDWERNSAASVDAASLADGGGARRTSLPHVSSGGGGGVAGSGSRGSLRRRGSGGLDIGSAKVVEVPFLIQRRNVAAVSRTTSGAGGAPVVQGTAGVGKSSTPSSGLPVLSHDVDGADESTLTSTVPDYQMRGLRLVALRDATAAELFVRQVESVLSSNNSAGSHVCVSLFVQQECTTVAPRTGCIRFMIMATSSRSPLPLRDRHIINHFVAGLLRGGGAPPPTIPARWSAHRSLLHVLHSAATLHRSHLLGVFHCAEADVFGALNHVAACGGYEVDVMIAQTHLDVQRALQQLIQRRDTLERTAASLTEELDGLGVRAEEQRRTILRQERQSADAFEASFACSTTALTLPSDLDATASMELTATAATLTTALAEQHHRQGQLHGTLSDLGAKMVTEVHDEGADDEGGVTPAIHSLEGTPAPRRSTRMVGLPPSQSPGRSRANSPRPGGASRRDPGLADLDADERAAVVAFFLPTDGTGAEHADVTLNSIRPHDIKEWRTLTALHAAQVAASTKRRQQLAQAALQAEQQVANAKANLAAMQKSLRQTQDRLVDAEASHPVELRSLAADLRSELASLQRRGEALASAAARSTRGYASTTTHASPPTAAAIVPGAALGTQVGVSDGGSTAAAAAAEPSSPAARRAAAVADFLRQEQPSHVAATRSLSHLRNAHNEHREKLLRRIDDESKRIAELRTAIEEPERRLATRAVPQLLHLFEFSATLHNVLRRYAQSSDPLAKMIRHGDFAPQHASRGTTAATLRDPLTALICGADDPVFMQSTRLFAIAHDAAARVALSHCGAETDLWEHEEAAIAGSANASAASRVMTIFDYGPATQQLEAFAPAAARSDASCQCEDESHHETVLHPPRKPSVRAPQPPPSVPKAELRAQTQRVNEMRSKLAEQSAATAVTTPRPRPAQADHAAAPAVHSARSKNPRRPC